MESRHDKQRSKNPFLLMVAGAFVISLIPVTIALFNRSLATPGAVNSPKAWFDATTIRTTDLPDAWGMREIKDLAVTGGEGYDIYFTPPHADPWFNISEEFYAFSTEELAQQFYLTRRDKVFPPGHTDAWLAQPDIEFAHHANEWKLACLPTTIDSIKSLGCATIARYDNMVVLIRAPVYETYSLTRSEYKSTLMAVDQRFVTQLEGSQGP